MTRALSHMPVRHQWGFRPLTSPFPDTVTLPTLPTCLPSSFPRHAIDAASAHKGGEHYLQVNGARHLSGLQQGALPESKAGAGRLLRVLGRGVRGQPVPRHRHHRVRALRACRRAAHALRTHAHRSSLRASLLHLATTHCEGRESAKLEVATAHWRHRAALRLDEVSRRCSARQCEVRAAVRRLRKWIFC